MKIYKSILFFLVISLSVNFSFANTSIPEEIIIAFKTGNSNELVKYFNNDIELVILEKEDVYSKVQAGLIIKNFFSKHSPTGFNIIHQGGNETSKYAIGKLQTSNGDYRIYLLLKIIDNQPIIHQLRIEKEDE
ncbi:MAG: DUF4783 domain-containing protein [Bacteroidales bacterium]|nr:DUF4783 domain-containing protein [Bacteroidales bacterium]